MKLTGGADLGATLLVRRAVRLVLLRDVAARRDVVRFVTFVFVDGLFGNALLLRIRLTHFVGAPHERHSRKKTPAMWESQKLVRVYVISKASPRRLTPVTAQTFHARPKIFGAEF